MHARRVCGICAPAMRIATHALLLTFFAGCSNSPTKPDASDQDTGLEDAGPPRDPNKNCVKPGTPNNELGVGGYCELKDDAGNFKSPPDCKATVDPDGGGMLYSFCTAGRAPDNLWFCTRPCEKGNDLPCGGNAYCDCNDQNQCGCIPNICGTPPDAGPKDGSTGG